MQSAVLINRQLVHDLTGPRSSQSWIPICYLWTLAETTNTITAWQTISKGSTQVRNAHLLLTTAAAPSIAAKSFGLQVRKHIVQRMQGTNNFKPALRSLTRCRCRHLQCHPRSPPRSKIRWGHRWAGQDLSWTSPPATAWPPAADRCHLSQRRCSKSELQKTRQKETFDVPCHKAIAAGSTVSVQPHHAACDHSVLLAYIKSSFPAV